MQRKLTIRRLGAKLPTLGLVVFLFFCIAIVWLSTIGLPQAVLRKIESLAAKEGLALKLGALRLQPSRGLAFGAENIRIYAAPGDAAPLASIKTASAGINATQLLTGHVKLDSLQLEGGKITLPVTDTPQAAINLDNITASARIGRKGMVRLTSGKLAFQGIPVRIQGYFPLPDLPESSANDGSVDLAAILREHAPVINETYRQIANQHWKEEELPELDLELKVNRQTSIGANASIPRFDIDQFHFRNATADVKYESDRIVINSLKFDTIDPDTQVSLKAGYDMSDRTISFSIDSTAALLRMARSLTNGEAETWISKFRHADENSPHITLRGDVGFEPDFSLRHASIAGNVMQDKLHIGNSLIERLELSFYYDNGDFNIDRLHVQFPKGSLDFSASAHNAQGQAELEANLPVERTLSLLSEFSGEPVALPEGLQLEGNLLLKARAELTTPLFEPGQTDWQDFVPSIRQAGLQLSFDKAAFRQTRLDKPCLELEVEGLEQDENMLPRAARKAQVHFKAQAVGLAGAEAPVSELSAPDIFLSASGLSLQGLCDVSMASAQFKLACDAVSGASLGIRELTCNGGLGRLSWSPMSFSVKTAEANVAAGSFECGELKGGKVSARIHGLKDLTPLAPWQKWIKKGAIRAEARQLCIGQETLGNLTMEGLADKGSQGRLLITLGREGEEAPSLLNLSAIPDWTDQERLHLCNVALAASPAAFDRILQQAGLEPKEFLLPERMELNGEAIFDTKTGRLGKANAQLRIPRIIRTPHTVKSLRGKESALAIEATADIFAQRNGSMDYRADFSIKHDSGLFTGQVQGNSAGRLHVKGDSTIGLATLDALIDMSDSHEIMRDFRIKPHSKTIVRDIDVLVDYSNGISVDSFCNVELGNIDYLMGAIVVDNQGNEKLRTDMGTNPYTAIKRCSCNVTAKVRRDMERNGQKLPREGVVTISNALINYDNGPWFARQDFSALGTAKGKTPKGAPRESAVTADKIIIDIERSFLELNRTQGNVYPAYAFGAFFPDLESYMSDVLLPVPAQVDTDLCVFPIYSDCTRPMSGVIKIQTPGPAGFRFIGATIPLNRFSGFISLTDDSVYLDRMNAKCWGGVLNAAVKLGIVGKSTSFDGFATAENMDLHKIAASYDSEQDYALANANIRFRSPSSELKDIEAYGEAVISNGNLMTLGIFQPIGDLLSDIPGYLTDLEAKVRNGRESRPNLLTRMATKAFKSTGKTINRLGHGIDWTSQNIPGLNHIMAYDLQDAYARFIISNGHLSTKSFKAKGYNMSVHAHMDIDLDTLEIRGNLWPTVSSLPAVILTPLTFLSDYVIDIVVHGTLDNINWKFGLDKRLKSAPPAATDAPGDPAYKPRARRKASKR